MLKTILNNIWLCIKFPFLYPRNVFSDYHHTNWKYTQFVAKHFGNYSVSFMFDIKKKDFQEQLFRWGVVGNHSYKVEFDSNNNLYISDTRGKLVCQRHLGEGKIIRVGWKQAKYLTVVVDDNYNITCSRFITITTNKWKKWANKILTWIHKYPLQIFYCIPTYTYLDIMPEGWRKAFGIQMCQEIKDALLKAGGYKALYNYRILQIKEKFGELRWYDANAAWGVQLVISKYEDISRKTCISCGKPAKYIRRGWISPYCEDCIDDKDYADEI